MNAERRRKRERNDPDRVTIGSPTERKVPTTNQSAEGEGEGDEDTLEEQNAVIAQLHTPSSFYHQFRKAMNSNNQGN